MGKGGGAGASLTKDVYPFVGIVIAFLVVLMVSVMDAASPIADDLQNGVQGAAAFLGIVFLIQILKKI